MVRVERDLAFEALVRQLELEAKPLKVSKIPDGGVRRPKWKCYQFNFDLHVIPKRVAVFWGRPISEGGPNEITVLVTEHQFHGVPSSHPEKRA